MRVLTDGCLRAVSGLTIQWLPQRAQGDAAVCEWLQLHVALCKAATVAPRAYAHSHFCADAK